MEFFEIVKSFIIGIIQGITEWLPVSSTGHMILFDEFVKMNVSDSFKEMFFVVIQLGSIMAVVLLYFHKLNPFSPKKTSEEKKSTLSLWGKVLVASIPAAIVGLLIDDFMDEYFYNYFVVSVALIVYGVAFIIIESNKNKKVKTNSTEGLTFKQSFLIGAFQMLALIPGTSRSGSTIIGATILGTSRSTAAEFSFFMAIPVMFGASGLKALKYVLEYGLNFSLTEITILAVGMVTAFLVSVVVIKFLMNYIKKRDFKLFGYYRIVLGLLVLGYFLIVK